MTGERARPVAARAIAAMTDGELELGDVTIRAMALTLCNKSLLEGLKAARWFQWSTFAFGAGAGWSGGQLAAGVEPMNGIAAMLLTGGVIGLAGALWHRRRALRDIAEGMKLEDSRDDLRAELARRGLADD